MLCHFCCVLAHKFDIGPDYVLRTVHLVHDEGHQKVHNAINDIIDLEGSKALSKIVGIDVGYQHKDKKNRVSCHPFLISHDLRIVLQTVTDPDKGHQEKNAVNQQEHTRNDAVRP
jgi:hypothetical protein